VLYIIDTSLSNGDGILAEAFSLRGVQRAIASHTGRPVNQQQLAQLRQIGEQTITGPKGSTSVFAQCA
jgi:hypothetical protein